MEPIRRLEIQLAGKSCFAPSITVNGYLLITTGRLLKIVSLHDEEYLDQPVKDPGSFLTEIKRSALKADIFCFSQTLPVTEPLHPFYFEWDNLAAITITTYEEWLNACSHQLRGNVQKARKEGITTRLVELSDDLVNSIMEIHNEAPVRQGRPFLHYGKSFQVLKKSLEPFAAESEYIGAYLGNALIGYLRMVRAGKTARIQRIVSMIKHKEKRPANALIAKAVEICVEEDLSYLIYGKYIYHTCNSLTDFKHRNGFEMVLVPRYYIPITWKGRWALYMRLHHTFKEMLPEIAFKLLNRLRRAINQRTLPDKPTA